MNLAVGSVVWISVDDPIADVIEVGVIEVEAVKREHCRLRDATGKVRIRHVDDVFATEILALFARCEQERRWALRYRNAERECAQNEERFRKRIEALLTAEPPRTAVR